MPLFFGRTNCDLQIPYKLDPNPWKQHQNWLAIERWATYFARNCSNACVPYELVISNPGTLSTTPSPPWQSGSPRRLTRLKLLVGGEIDTSDVTIVAYNNTDTIATLTLPAGDNTLYVEEASLDADYTNFGTDGQFLTFEATDVGDNLATRVTLIAYFTCGDEGGSPPDPPGGGGGE